ncbi:hypothetical protein CONCODRAFT_19474 [Conidiobolus coronatus NRRL 28638]|uniref:Uncharacterized protein n=1 Tax=Conidiobolus coronatus (strain ATCC 28846 / CBS 209.66 / NRRL 28638) TaxID=796925 RepID=A0A137NXP3_CONC2|nr:hypothetical protein CONCODRAFT_19474 [Conidiobolus coronatus NRRL 28638]|eukprot:KXN67633.1 hypothetical protein CONCODRAFT_19474 [Conidiobolus coronatus NRRL 28638]
MDKLQNILKSRQSLVIFGIPIVVGGSYLGFKLREFSKPKLDSNSLQESENSLNNVEYKASNSNMSNAPSVNSFSNMELSLKHEQTKLKNTILKLEDDLKRVDRKLDQFTKTNNNE